MNKEQFVVFCCSHLGHLSKESVAMLQKIANEGDVAIDELKLRMSQCAIQDHGRVILNAEIAAGLALKREAPADVTVERAVPGAPGAATVVSPMSPPRRFEPHHVHCCEGHELLPSNGDVGFGCHQCGALSVRASPWHCSACDYDLCDECAHRYTVDGPDGLADDLRGESEAAQNDGFLESVVSLRVSLSADRVFALEAAERTALVELLRTTVAATDAAQCSALGDDESVNRAACYADEHAERKAIDDQLAAAVSLDLSRRAATAAELIDRTEIGHTEDDAWATLCEQRNSAVTATLIHQRAAAGAEETAARTSDHDTEAAERLALADQLAAVVRVDRERREAAATEADDRHVAELAEAAARSAICDDLAAVITAHRVLIEQHLSFAVAEASDRHAAVLAEAAARSAVGVDLAAVISAHRTTIEQHQSAAAAEASDRHAVVLAEAAARGAVGADLAVVISAHRIVIEQHLSFATAEASTRDSLRGTGIAIRKRLARLCADDANAAGAECQRRLATEANTSAAHRPTQAEDPVRLTGDRLASAAAEAAAEAAARDDFESTECIAFALLDAAARFSATAATAYDDLESSESIAFALIGVTARLSALSASEATARVSISNDEAAAFPLVVNQNQNQHQNQNQIQTQDQNQNQQTATVDDDTSGTTQHATSSTKLCAKAVLTSLLDSNVLIPLAKTLTLAAVLTPVTLAAAGHYSAALTAANAVVGTAVSSCYIVHNTVVAYAPWQVTVMLYSVYVATLSFVLTTSMFRLVASAIGTAVAAVRPVQRRCGTRATVAIAIVLAVTAAIATLTHGTLEFGSFAAAPEQHLVDVRFAATTLESSSAAVIAEAPSGKPSLPSGSPPSSAPAADAVVVWENKAAVAVVTFTTTIVFSSFPTGAFVVVHFKVPAAATALALLLSEATAVFRFVSNVFFFAVPSPVLSQMFSFTASHPTPMAAELPQSDYEKLKQVNSTVGDVVV